MDGRGIKKSDGTFLTSADKVMTDHGSFSSPFRIETFAPSAIAARVIPAFTCVTSTKQDKIDIATGKRWK